jgi:pyruvate-ferredoxin/flavodoxin oxidoreductase
MPVVFIDGNEAAARAAYALSEVIALYPITPASPMGELCDAWSAEERTNLLGDVPRIVEMQSEGGAAGALHGALQRGTLATTFTASQGLLLMLPNMFKIAGELSPTVIHVAARAIATHALSIFGDHSDVMAARTTGWALLASSSPQAAHDLAVVSHVASLRTRVPFLHFFDGFRTSHEIQPVSLLGDDELGAMFPEEELLEHRERGLSPERPVLRGTAQNPDVFFQAREAVNPYYDAAPDEVRRVMTEFATLTGRHYDLVEYRGAPDADRVVITMGSSVGPVEETVRELNARGERVGMIEVRLFRPFPVDALLDALPSTVERVAVLDRTKEPGAVGEPLFTDVTTTFAEAATSGSRPGMPLVVGARYGLGSKEFTPTMVKGLLDELAAPQPRRRMTLGIVDDVTRTSVEPDRSFRLPRRDGDVSAVFYGLGSDGTVGANKDTVSIVGERAGLEAQGYFVYDSKKSGAVTVSHLRFSDAPITSSYLIDEADVVAVHQFVLLGRRDILRHARRGGKVLLNAPFAAEGAFHRLPRSAQEAILDLDLELHVVDAHRIAGEVGLGGRINTVMQPCFFAVAGLLPLDEAVEAMKEAVRDRYGKRGQPVVDRNLEAIDRGLAELRKVEVPAAVTATNGAGAVVPDTAPDFVQRVTARLMAGEGDLLPVSALPVDGTFPTGTAVYEKRSIAQEIPVWDPEICIDCGKCAIVCPHAAIRMKAFTSGDLEDAPAGYKSKVFRSKDLPDHLMTIQVAPDDCTGCGVCVDICPAKSKEEVGHKSIDMLPADEHRAAERERWSFFKSIPELDRRAVHHDSVKSSQLLEPLFEFSGACAGCGETPYLKLLTQLFGDRIVVANATGCSSIYGGNLPTTPWSRNAEGRGPAWSNSLFEDNAEFGLGIRLGLEHEQALARRLLGGLASEVGEALAEDILAAEELDETGVQEQRARIEELRARLGRSDHPDAPRLAVVADTLSRQSVWIVGGDGWAYDIGYGGLDHVLASGMDVNILVLDTEVYSNTGGQASKATPRGAVAKFAAAGKATPKKDLGMLATQYGHVYVAQVAIGANDMQTVRALREAEAWPGPSLVLAYSTCIAHGVDMARSMAHMKDAVSSGHWPLYRYQPADDEHATPLRLDSAAPRLPLADFARSEARFAMLERADPERAHALLEAAQEDVHERRRYYEQLAGVERTIPPTDDGATEPEEVRP